jgi:hypothetical protein
MARKMKKPPSAHPKSKKERKNIPPAKPARKIAKILFIPLEIGNS